MALPGGGRELRHSTSGIATVAEVSEKLKVRKRFLHYLTIKVFLNGDAELKPGY